MPRRLKQATRLILAALFTLTALSGVRWTESLPQVNLKPGQPALMFDDPSPEVNPDLVEIKAISGGPQKWATLLCKFADVSAEPQPPAFFKNMFERTNGPSLNDYWREISYDYISSLTTDVFGWYPLPGTRAAYGFSESTPGFDHSAILNDCASAAGGAVNLGDYDYFMVVVNSPNPVAISSLGTSGPVLPSNKWNLATVPHEMGHTYGLIHSKAGGSQTANVWDLMSSHVYNCGFNPDPTYGCLAQHPIAYYKDLLGFIPASQKITISGGIQTVTLERLAQPQTGNYLLALVQNPSTLVTYSVEARQRVGYDSKLPGDGVIIHKVNGLNAELIDGDNNGVFDDAGAIWTPGETFTDAANKISITVESATATGYVVTLNATGSNVQTTLTLNPSSPVTDDEVTFNIRVTNSGDPATGTTLTAEVPTGMTYVNSSATTPQGSASFAAPLVTFNLGTLASNSSLTLSFKATVDSSVTTPTVTSSQVEVTWTKGSKSLTQVIIINAEKMFLPLVMH